jgi:hypothetical protein
MGTIIPMSADQENRFEACLQRHGGSYNIATNNCATPVQNCLRNVGISDFYNSADTTLGVNGNHVFPVDLGMGLLSSKASSTLHAYPAKREPTIIERL